MDQKRLEELVEREWEIWVNIAYRLMTTREVFGAEIMNDLQRCGKDITDPFWREYLPAPLHFMTFLAYAKRKRMEAEEIERIRREAQKG